jgi:3-dehydroquinate synthase
MKELRVGLDERSYPIFIGEGVLDWVGTDLLARRIGKRYVVVADDRVAGMYGKRLAESLRDAGLDFEMLTFPHGEGSKHLNTVADLASGLARLGVDRKDALIALGGGVTGDITGFLASIFMRGIPFVQVPTSLLAQVDSSVGGKTGVDIPEGKNLVGTFYQPRAVYIDSRVLSTLPAAELLNGLAEVIKYGVIRDGEFFAFLEAQRTAILGLDPAVLAEMIGRCCAIKAEVVAADEREADLRRILNYGHSIGHAVEAASGYQLPHGLAVAIGMVAVNRLAVAMGLLTTADSTRITALLEAYGLPVRIPAGYRISRIKEYLKSDKKSVGGRVFFVLPEGVGRVKISDAVSEAQIETVLQELGAV